MNGLKVDELSVRYIGRSERALDEISLDVTAGHIVALAGRTGSGKSTLCLASSGLVPRVVRAAVTGSILLGSADGEVEATKANAADLGGRVGIVFSTPSLQLSASKPTVREELAFGLENLGIARAEMDGRIDAAMSRLGVEHLADREPLALSGGEQQRVAIAAIVVMGTGVVVLDEPTAQLDPQGTSEITELLSEMAADGRAVLVSEHAADVLGAAGSCLVLDKGRVVARGLPGEVLARSEANSAGIDPPTVVTLAIAAGVTASAAFNERAIAAGLAAKPVRDVREPSPGTRIEETSHGEPILVRATTPVSIEVKGLSHTYAGGVEALRGVDLAISPGEAVAIIGQNGSGKTTLVKHLNGLLRPTAGQIVIDGRDTASRLVSDLARTVGFVFQDPDDQLFHSRVDREVAFGPRNMGFDSAHISTVVESALKLTRLTDQRATNPYDLDLSTRKLVALAGVLATESPVLVLDEPTMGQDGPGRHSIESIIRAWRSTGRTVIAISHDMEFVARNFDRIVVMRQGQIVLDGPPSMVFAPTNVTVLESTGLRPPPAARIAALMGLSVVSFDAADLINASLAISASRQ